MGLKAIFLQHSPEATSRNVPRGVELHAFGFEKAAFFFEGGHRGFAEKTAERTIGTNDPMARHLGRERVFLQGLPDCAG